MNKSLSLFAVAAVSLFAAISCEKTVLTVDDTIEEPSILFTSDSLGIIDINDYSSAEFAEMVGVDAPVETKCLSINYEVVRMKYQSTGVNGKPITLSMKIAYPVGILGNYHKPTHIVLDNHFTIGSNAEAPYNITPIAFGCALEDALVVCPDYEGYGITDKNDPPYICHEVNAKQSVDAVLAALDYIDAKRGVSMAKGYYLENYGYSQGGGVALAVHKYIETELPASTQKRLNLKRSYCGGGPYNPVTTFHVFREWDELEIPMVAILPILGAKACFPEILGKYELCDFFTEEFNRTEMIEMMRSKEYSIDEMNAYIRDVEGLRTCKQIFNPDLLDENSQMFKDLVYCLEKSNLTTDWKPNAKVYLYHSKADTIVPMENCEEAYAGLVGGNVTRMWAPTAPSHGDTGILFYVTYMGVAAACGAIATYGIK